MQRFVLDDQNRENTTKNAGLAKTVKLLEQHLLLTLQWQPYRHLIRHAPIPEIPSQLDIKKNVNLTYRNVGAKMNEQ